MQKSQEMLTGKHVMVTGASSGLGAHFAKVCALLGAKVTVAARRKGRLEDLVEKITSVGGKAQAVSLDVKDQGSIRSVFEAASMQYGVVDVLINNAGVALTKPALDITEEDWDFVIDTNLKGAWFVAQEAAMRLKEVSKPGSIVNIASILGFRVAGAVAPYAISKAAVIQMTKTQALEWARYGIRVNALAPGYIETELNKDFFKSPAGEAIIKRIPQRRLGKVEELNGPLLLLASDMSSFMNGSIVEVDGGHLLSTL